MLTIRPLQPADAAALKALRVTAVEEFPKSFYPTLEEESTRPVEAFRGWLETPESSMVFGAFDGVELVAVVGLSFEIQHKLRHRAMLRSVYTRPAYRGRGLSRQLVEAAIDEVRRRGHIRVLRLAVHSENTAAKSLYASMGFTRYGIEPKAMLVNGCYVDEEQMALEI